MSTEPNGDNAPGFEPGSATPGGPGEPGSEVPKDTEPNTPPAGTNGQENGGAPAPTANQENPQGTPNPEDPNNPPANGETPSNEGEKELEGIIQGWKEDREALQVSERENLDLKNKISQLTQQLALLKGEDEEEDSEFAGLTREQREAKIVEKHQQAEAEKAEKTRQEVAREIAFHERTSKEFRENKDAVLKIAADFNCTSLDQAMKFWKAQQAVKNRAKTAAEIENDRKHNAGITPGGNGNGAPAPKGYDPTRDRDVPIRDMYLGK